MAKITKPRKIHHGPELARLDSAAMLAQLEVPETKPRLKRSAWVRTKIGFFGKKTEAVIWFLLAIIFFLLAFSSWYYRPSQVHQLLKEADASFKSGSYQDSYTLLNKAVLLDNSNPDIHFKLSKTFEATNNWPQAQKELLLALELSPNSNTIAKELTKVNTTIAEPGRIKNEINFWEKETITKPDYRDAYLQLAVRYYQLYKLDLAKQNLAKANSLDPNFESTKKLLEIIK